MTINLNLKALTDKISDRDFAQICADNHDTRLEMTKEGQLIIMPPTGSITGGKNSDLLGQVWYWNRQAKLGKVFDSSTGFTLSNGAIRSPDVSWIERSRWNSLTPQQQKGFASIAPDFAIELMSPTDVLKETQQKMSEYLDCGVKLGWLINPDAREVEVYELEQPRYVLQNVRYMYGGELLPGLAVDLAEIWS